MSTSLNFIQAANMAGHCCYQIQITTDVENVTAVMISTLNPIIDNITPAQGWTAESTAVNEYIFKPGLPVTGTFIIGTICFNRNLLPGNFEYSIQAKVFTGNASVPICPASDCGDGVIATDVCTYSGQEVQLESFVYINNPNHSGGAFATLEMPLPMLGVDGNPHADLNSSPIQSSSVTINSASRYLVLSRTGENFITDGGQWGMNFDPCFFINNFPNYQVKCVNPIDPILFSDANLSSSPTLVSPRNSQGILYNGKWHNYYFIVENSSILICRNFFAPTKDWLNLTDNTMVTAYTLGNKNQANVMRFRIYELCPESENYDYLWEPIRHNIQLSDTRIRNPIFPAITGGGNPNYNFKLTVTKSSGVHFTTTITVHVYQNTFNTCV